MKKILVFAVAFQAILSSMAWGLQLSQLRTAVRLDLRDSATDVNFQRFSDSQINGVINEAQREVARYTLLLQGTSTFGLTAGIREYDLPTDFMVPLRVTISNKRLTQVSFNTLDQDQTDWTISQATPTAYYINDNNSTDLNPIIGFNPTPSTNSVNSVQLFYAQIPATLNLDTDIPFNGRLQYVVYHDILADWAAWKLWTIQGRKDYADVYMGLYQMRLKNLKDNLGTMPDFNPAARGDRGPRQ